MTAPVTVSLNVPRPLETALTELLLASRQLMHRLRAEWYGPELSWLQVSAMARLENSGPMTTADLARAEAVKPQSMGAALAALEKEDLVQRRPHPTDGRQVLFMLTPAGTAARKHASLVKQQWLAAAMAEFSPAERQTLVAATRLIRRLGKS
jgi:DNA-binding MarR family transcriptional regulator